MNENEITKAQLLQRIAVSWQALQEMLSGLDETTLKRPDPESGWTISDHVFHLAAWERGIAYLLTRRSRYEGMGITAEQWQELTMDEINEEVHRAGQKRLPAEALAIGRQSHQEMLDALADLTEADLFRDYSYYDPSGEPDGRPIVGWIIGNTFGHYDEHLDYIRSMLDQQS
jgi:hypothetical protein